VEFHAVPPQVEPPSATVAPPDWAPLFEAAALPLASFYDVGPLWTPRGFADVRRAWEGPLPDVPEVTARVEAASYRGKPVFFSVLLPWTAPGRMVTPPANAIGRLLTASSVVMAFALLVVTLILTRRHLRTGRGDRRGAFRTATVVFVVVGAGFLLRARFFSSLDIEYARLGLILSLSLYNAVNVWLFYIALEPYVRRFWPQLLIGWTRLISGHMRDPLVGRDVLVGVAAGTVAAFLIASRELAPHVLGLRPVIPNVTGALMLLGSRHVFAVAMQMVRGALGNVMQIVGIVVFLKIIVKRTWLVLVLSSLAILPFAMSGTFAAEELAIELSISFIGIALVLAVLLRFGLLSLIVTFYTYLLVEAFPLTSDFSRPYAGVTISLLAVIVGLSIFGFVASRGGESLFGRAILD
jgi:serine/threonine-protein kinase